MPCSPLEHHHPRLASIFYNDFRSNFKEAYDSNYGAYGENLYAKD